MRLYTIQDYDLRTFDGPIKLSLGTYNINENISRAQQKLYELVGEDQVIWCSQDEPFLKGKAGRYLHKIDFDFRDRVAIVDSLVWGHIIGDDPQYIPPDDLSELRSQIDTNGDYETAIQKAKDEYLAANLPADLWSAVRKQEITKDSDQVLVGFRFSFSKIVHVKRISEDMAQGQ